MLGNVLLGGKGVVGAASAVRAAVEVERVQLAGKVYCLPAEPAEKHIYFSSG